MNPIKYLQKIFLFIVSICLMSTYLKGQVWDKTLNLFPSEYASDVVETPDGGFIFVGSSLTYGQDGIYAVKKDINGFTQWIKEFSGYGVNSLVLTHDNNIAIGCDLQGMGRDFGIIKINLNGDVLWSNVFKYSGSQYASDIIETKDSSFVIIGSEKFQPSGGNTDIVVIKADKDGNEQWVKKIGAEEFSDLGFTVAESKNGGYFIGGALSENEDSNQDAFIIKLDILGNQVWKYQAQPTSYSDGITSIIEALDGSIYYTTNVNLIYRIGKLNSEGEKIWEKYPFLPWESCKMGSLIFTKDSSLVLTGVHGKSILVVKVNLEGEYIWHKLYSRCTLNSDGIENFYRSNSIIETTDKGFVIAGDESYTDAFFLKVDSLGNSSIGSNSFYFESYMCDFEPFLYHGKYYYQPGIYSFGIDENIPSDQICDSLVVFRLIQAGPTEEFISSTICDGEEYIFQGDTLMTEGIYHKTLLNSNQFGCDSSITLTLLLAPKTSSTSFVSICQGDSVVVGDHIFSQTGQYSVILPNNNSYGCDSVVNLNLEIFPEITIIDTLIVNDDGTSSGKIWVTAVGGTPPYLFIWDNGIIEQNLNNLEAGSYSLQVIDSKGCSSFFVFNVALVTSIMNANPSNLLDFRIYPNPATKGRTIGVLPLNGQFLNKKAQIQLRNIYGQVLLNKDIIFSKEKITDAFVLPQISGIFMLNILFSDTGETFSTVLIVL